MAPELSTGFAAARVFCEVAGGPYVRKEILDLIRRLEGMDWPAKNPGLGYERIERNSVIAALGVPGIPRRFYFTMRSVGIVRPQLTATGGDANAPALTGSCSAGIPAACSTCLNAFATVDCVAVPAKPPVGFRGIKVTWASRPFSNATSRSACAN